MPVYFAQLGDAQVVKIGWATNVARRIAVIQAGQIAPFNVIREIAGGRTEEAWLHRYFAAENICREFFNLTPEMLSVSVPGKPHQAKGWRRAGNFVCEITDRWGSVAEFARDIGVPYGSAVAMKARNSIALWHWTAIAEAAERRGFHDITLEKLSSELCWPTGAA